MRAIVDSTGERWERGREKRKEGRRDREKEKEKKRERGREIAVEKERKMKLEQVKVVRCWPDSACNFAWYFYVRAVRVCVCVCVCVLVWAAVTMPLSVCLSVFHSLSYHPGRLWSLPLCTGAINRQQVWRQLPVLNTSGPIHSWPRE